MSSLPTDDERRPPAAPGAPAHGDGAAWAPTELIPRARRVPGGGNALPVGTRLAEFELQRVIGEGGFGIVYQAQDHTLQRRVAIKEYLPATLAMRTTDMAVTVSAEKHRAVFEAGLASFINEARLLAQFDHPSLVKVYRFWPANGTAYMVMPFYEGATLKQTLQQLGAPPDERWLMALLAPLTEALAVIHAAHWLHRDISPDNILLLAGSGRPLLLDFGAARQVIGDATQALTAILKPGYAPVEQYAEASSLKQGPWTDVYALCAVVYAALMGSKPPVSVARTMTDHCTPLVRSAAGRCSPAFLQAIDDGLRVRPDERTASIADLRVALGLDRPADGNAPVARHVPPAVSPVGPTEAPMAPVTPVATTWLRLPGLAAAGVLVAALAAAAYWAGQRQSPAPAATTPPVVAQAVPAAVPSSAPSPPLPGAQTAAPLAAPPLPVAPSVAEAFQRVVAAQQPDFQVKAQARQARLRIGHDRLDFEVSAARDGHVYVLVGGPDDSLLLLYPNSVAKDNPLRAGQTLRLPQASWPLDTAEPAGTEHFLVIVSAQPRDFGHLSRAREAWFLKLPASALAERPAAGGQPTLAGQVHCSSPGCDAYGAARFTVDVVR